MENEDKPNLISVGKESSEKSSTVSVFEKVSDLQSYIRKKGTRTVSPVPLINGNEQVSHNSQNKLGRGRRLFRRPDRNDYDDESDFQDIKTWLKQNSSNIPRIIFTAICLSIAIYQTVQLVQDFLQFP